MWERDGVQIVRRVLVHDRDPMMTPIARNPEAASLPVYQWIESHKKGNTTYQVRVHGSNPEILIKIHGMHLSLHMHKLGASDSISVRHFECLAAMQLVPAQI